MALLSLLLDHGASTTAVDKAGQTAGTLAFSYGLTRIEALFALRKRADAPSKL
jgi:ankyrin repeat protein